MNHVVGVSPGPEKRSASFSISWNVFVQIVAWLVASLLTYSAINARVSVAEDRINDIKSQLQEIRTDVKSILLQRKP